MSSLKSPVHPSTDDSQLLPPNTVNDAARHREQAGAGELSSLSPASVLLPLPTSANRIWRRFGKRMVKNPEYVAWQQEAAHLIVHSKLRFIAGGYNLRATFPDKMRMDIDNCIKPLNDILVRTGIVQDDKHCRNLTLSRGDVPKGHCYLEITPN